METPRVWVSSRILSWTPNNFTLQQLIASKTFSQTAQYSLCMTRPSLQLCSVINQCAVQQTEEKFESNNFKMNKEKTQYLTIDTRPNNDSKIKFLGIYIQPRQSRFRVHIDELIKKLSVATYTNRRTCMHDYSKDARIHQIIFNNFFHNILILQSIKF